MELLGALYALLLMPIQLVLEELYMLCFSLTQSPGASVALLSLVMCIPTLPLLACAQRASQQGTSGDTPVVKALKNCVPLVILLPYFAASAVFTSSMQMLQNEPLGPIANLAASDGLLSIGGITIHILPIIVTILGIVASVIATRKAGRAQLIVQLAATLLIAVVLYVSPAATSVFWGVFCLCRIAVDLVRQLLPRTAKAPQEAAAPQKQNTSKQKRHTASEPQPSVILLLLSGLFLAVLVGCYVLSASILPSAELFTQGSAAVNPVKNLENSALIAVGFFIIWPAITYLLLNKRGRGTLNILMLIACAVAAINCVSFFEPLLTVDEKMMMEKDPALVPLEIGINIACIIVAAVAVPLLYKPLRKGFFACLPVATVVLAVLFAQNAVAIDATAKDALVNHEDTMEETPTFTLSKTGKNVITIMVDRGMSVYVPYIMNERPDIKEAFDGFTYYPNTASFSGKTIVGSPCFYGGYEYTPENSFKRSNMSNKKKQNEALKVMPVMFDKAGFETTVLDPTFAGYKWVPDLSIFKKYPNIRVFNARGSFPTPEKDQRVATGNLRNTFCYGLMRSAPVPLRPVLYYGGTYNNTDALLNAEFQTTGENVLVAYGQRPAFVEAIRTLQEMRTMTLTTAEKKNTFLMMSCDSAHDIATLQEPSYTSEPKVNNTAYEATHADRLTVDGTTINMKTQVQVSHYQCNMATFIQLAQWLNYLKAEGIYDNTRIVISADHGYHTAAIDGRTIKVDNPDENEKFYDIEHYHPLLMVKDFNSTGFTTDETFMTHADVPTLTTQGVIDNPTNPFTGKKIAATKKDKETVNVFSTFTWQPWKQKGNTFDEENTHWFSVHDDVRDPANWKEIENPVTSGKDSDSK